MLADLRTVNWQSRRKTPGNKFTSLLPQPEPGWYDQQFKKEIVYLRRTIYYVSRPRIREPNVQKLWWMDSQLLIQGRYYISSHYSLVHLQNQTYLLPINLLALCQYQKWRLYLTEKTNCYWTQKYVSRR